MDCLVEYEYVPQEDDELALHKGNIVRNASISEEGWLKGEINGMVGLFPDNFVKIIGKTANGHINENHQEAIDNPVKYARVLHPYLASVKNELDLKMNSLVEIIELGEPGWLKARVDGNIGWIPSNFVQMCSPPNFNQTKESHCTGPGHTAPTIPEQMQRLKDLHSEIISSKIVDNSRSSQNYQPNVDGNEGSELALVKYPYRASNTDELSLEVGDIILIIDKGGEESGWWKGELNGKTGVFPDNFVELLPRSMPIEKESGRYSADTKEDKQQTQNLPLQRKVANFSPAKSMDLFQNSTEARMNYLESLGVYPRQPDHAAESSAVDKVTPPQSDSNHNNYNDLVKFFQSNSAITPQIRAASSTNSHCGNVTDRILKGLATAAKNAAEGTGFTVYNTKSNTLRPVDEKTLQALIACIENANKEEDNIEKTKSAPIELQGKRVHSVNSLPPAYPPLKCYSQSAAHIQDHFQKRKQLENSQQQLHWRPMSSCSKVSHNPMTPTPALRNHATIQSSKNARH